MTKKQEKTKKIDEIEFCKYCMQIGKGLFCSHIGNPDRVHAPHNRLKRKRCEEQFCPLIPSK